MALTTYTAPTTEPLTLAEVKAHLILDPTDSTDDHLLTMFISSVRFAAEQITKRAMITQTLDLTLDEFPKWELCLPKPVLQSVTSITYVDTAGASQTLSASDYMVDIKTEPARLTPAYGLYWPLTRYQMNAVTIRFVAGYGAAAAVPAGIKNWMLMRLATLWENRQAVVIERGMNMIELPPSFIDGLLDPYRVYGVIDNEYRPITTYRHP